MDKDKLKLEIKAVKVATLNIWDGTKGEIDCQEVSLVYDKEVLSTITIPPVLPRDVTILKK